ncbi:DotI/IcmL family type IV secretion protein [Acerihabitans sp. TG2]|uniref:DotI/IcmL family type IV secretion protein n=1 Tax=Acerihabitans sp. TG2 TaxID=3096008 RepID=UPI002B22652E|nr:DotI/IcmL family type IV secretion protein [Acerihabitans sp. TG2]MEA9392224.1 DotI/IcmL family type IV secretion protein [Acerihabitans sp. TG2]
MAKLARLTMFFKTKRKTPNDNIDSIASNNEALSIDFSSNKPSASIIRENARLASENIDLRSRAKKNISALIILGLTFLFLLWLWVFYFPQYRFVSTLDNASICAIPSSENPDTTPESILDYAKDAVLNTYSYDYVNYRSKINDTANRYYNNEGRIALFHSLDDSENLTRVIKGKLILKSMATNVPQIEKQDKAKTFWIVNVPITIEFYANGSDKPIATTPYIAIVRVVKEKPSKTRKKAIAIEQVLLKTGRG